ncbi:MAG TPA: YjgN family protein [Burkholderiales bacterium]|nr:YjgN family protein [Burkholderiales bacterium]
MDQPLAAQATGLPPTPAGPRVLRPVFTGNAREYFRIWIVNLFFSLVTLGIYSAWAKVRKKKYFYGSTTLDGDSFDYLGSPKAILKGRIVAAAVVIIYGFASQLYPGSQAVFLVIGFFILPWLISRALAFNARNSAWRGLRFDFTANAKTTAKFYLPRILLLLVSLGLFYPRFAARQREFTLNHHAYGTSGLHCELSVRQFYGIYILAGLMVGGIGAVLGVLMGMGAGRLFELPEAVAGWAFILVALPGYAAYGMAYAYIQSRAGNAMWNSARVNGMRFESTLGAWRLGWLYVGNVVAAALSLGLLIPWGVTRVLRYRLEHFAVIIDEEVVHEASPALARVDAAGQELGDFFNVDFGL